MRILIADDHIGVRHGLREILADALPEGQFIEAANGNEVLGHLRIFDVDLILLDINMPGRSGLHVLEDLVRSHPRVPVVMVSVQPEDQYAPRCLRSGAAAYVNKDKATEELAHVVKKVLAEWHPEFAF